MPSTLERTIYGEAKNIGFDKFNIGSLTKAITFDLEEFGQKGVQGLAIKGKEAEALIKYEKAAKRAAEAYIVAGTVKGQLCLVVRDKKNANFEAMSVLVKDYAKIREELAKSSAAVVNIEPDKNDTVIPGAASAQADRFGTGVQSKEDADFGGINGNIVLCAHGAPKVVPGRVIGKELGEMSVDAMVKFLTGNKDKSKRISKDYSGQITLSGCYTASGGPEADRQDDAYAKKVRDALVKKGYKSVVVVGMPGPSWTARENAEDDYGSRMKRGEKGVFPGMSEDEEGVEALRQQVDKLTEGLIAASKKSPDPKNFMGTPPAKAVLAKIAGIEKEMKEIQGRLDSGTERSIKGLKGTYGLRQIKASLGL